MIMDHDPWGGESRHDEHIRAKAKEEIILIYAIPLLYTNRSLVAHNSTSCLIKRTTARRVALATMQQTISVLAEQLVGSRTYFVSKLVLLCFVSKLVLLVLQVQWCSKLIATEKKQFRCAATQRSRPYGRSLDLINLLFLHVRHKDL